MADEGAVQVCVRLRPPNARERSSQGCSEAHWKTDNQTIFQINGAKSFNFDRVFHATETTQTVYTEVAHSIVCSITEGYNGTIFAYGQTSSGKTYTMMGNADAPGLIPLAICNLFKVINEMQNREFLLRVSYMEIYNESVSDLLSDSKGRPLEVREDMNRNIYVADLTEEVAVTYDAVMKWVKKGEKNRHYGETKMNERSSRSHTIFRVIVESRDKDNEAVMVAHLNLVDLAGSERASQTGAEGVRLKEGCNINRSLFVLGQVIKKLSDGQAGGFVNYRDSKLTRILQNSLGGNARTLIICTITPAAFEETLSTLQFASTAKFMKNTPHVNEVLDDQAMLKRYLKEIVGLKDKLEALTSETRVHEMEKAQLLSEKHHLQQEQEQKIKNLTRMLVRASSDEDQLDTKARRKRRFTWAPGKVRVSLNSATDNAAKIIKLDQAFQELDEIPEEFLDDQQSDMMSGCSSQITVRRGGSCGYQIPSFEDSSHFNDQSRLSQTSFTSILYDGSPKDESEKRISELEQELEDMTKEKEKQIIQLKNDAKHLEKQLKGSVELCELLYSEKSDAESLKMENEKHKEEIRELKQLLEEKLRNEKYFKMENEKQNNEIQELTKLRDGYEERREIEEFEFLEKEVEKEEKAQQKHEIAKLKELVHNSEVFNQELEAELKTKTKQLKDKEQSCLVLQQRLDQLKELSDGQMDLETLMIQIKQLQQSLNDAEVVTCDAKKESAFLRSENLELKETMNEKMVKYQQMEKDVQLYYKKLDTEQSRYKQMQSDLQKELKSVYSENAKLMSLLDGKVPKDILDRVSLEKSITDLNQQLEKAKKENISLQQEVAILSQNKLLPQKVDELEKQVLKLTKELNGVIFERDNLLAGKEENDEKLINLRGEVLLSAQERDELQEEVNSLQYERHHQDNLKAEQQNEVQSRVESLKLELELYCTQLEEERAKCSQLQHNVEGKEGQVKELEQQLEQELVKQKEINDKFSKASEDIKLLNEVKEELITKLQVLTKANEELAMSQPKSQKDEEPLNVSSAAEITETHNLTEQLLVLQENCKVISEEKEQLHEELLSLQIERDQLKCDLQDNIEMCIENQAELRNLHDKLKLKQNVEMELTKSLAEKECLINEEKKKSMQASEALDLAQEELRYQQQLVNELRNEIQEKKDLLLSVQENFPERADDKVQELTEHLQNEVPQPDLEDEMQEPCVHSLGKQNTNIQEESNQCVQQREDEKSSTKEENKLEVILQDAKIQKNEIKSAPEENTEMQNQADELCCLVAQRDTLLAEIQELRARASKEQETVIQEEEFNQQFQQLENEKLSLLKEKDEFLKTLKYIKAEKDEMKRALEEKTEATQKQGEELHRAVSQCESLLTEIEELRARVFKEQEAEIQEEEFNQQFQQLEDEKSSLIKERDELQEKFRCIEVEKDEMKKTLQENAEMMQKQTEELHHLNSQRGVLLDEIDKLRAHVSKEQEAVIQEEEFNQRFQQLEDEKLSLVKEKADLQDTLKCIEAEKDEMKKVLQENSEVTQKQGEELHHVVSQRDMLLAEIERLRACVLKEKEVEIQEKEFSQRFQQLEDEKSSLVKERDELQKTLMCIKAEQDEMTRALQEKTDMQNEELGRMVSQHDMLLAEIEGLRARVLKEKDEIQEKEFSQWFQQLEDEKSSLVKERDELQKTLKCIKAEQDEMTRALQEKTDMMQKQDEELGRMVSQRDVLLFEVEELRAHTSKVPEAEIQEDEFNQQLQQLANEKLSIVKEKQELKDKLKAIKAERDEMEKALQENNEMMQKQHDELHQVMSQRDMLLTETEELRDRASKEQKAEIQEVEFNQRLQQLEDEKSSIMKERSDLQESLACIKIESDEMKSTLQEKLQEQAEELHRLVSQRDLLLNDIKELRTHASKEQSLEILEEKFNQRVQQLEVEKLAIVKEKDELQEMLERIQVQKDEMKRTLQENTEANQVQAKELNGMVSQRDMLLDEIKELRTLVSKERNTHILEEKFNQQLQQLEDEKSALVNEMAELQEKLDCVKIERDEMKRAQKESTQLKIEERRNKELTELVTSLEKQVVTLKEQTQIETTTPENEAEINKLSNYLQEKDRLLQETIQSLFQLENEYKIKLAKTDQQLSREGEEWNELLVKFCSKFPEESTEAISIKKLQEENQKLYEKLVLWRSHFMRALSTVPQNVKKYQIPISKCDLGLADEKKKNEELCIQLQTLKKQVSDLPMLELTLQEKNPEILRLSTLIEFKENHLTNTQQTLSELKLKYQSYLRSTKNGLSSKAKAREVFKERVSVVSSINALKTIEEIEHEMRTLNQDLQLQNEAVQNEATFSKSVQTGYVKYIRNSCNEMANQKKKNDELLLEIETFRQQSFNKNGCDPILAMENQKLKKKMKTDEQLLQTMGMKIQELELALTTSQEINKLQGDKVTQLQTELSSKTENKLEDLQTALLKKDNQINSMEEALKQLQAKLDMGAQPFREEMHELKNRLFILEMEKVKESKNLENQISSLKASLEHKEELMRQTKETLRRYQQKQDTTIMVENNNEMCSTDTSLTCSAGSGIVQNALLLVLNSEKAKLNQDLNRLKKENARLARTVSELKYENTKWKDRALKLKEKERESSEHQRENVPQTFTPSLEEGITPCSVTMPQNFEPAVLLPSEVKTGAKLDETSLTSEKMLPVDSPKLSSIGTESKWLLPRSKIFDNSQLGFPAAESPQRKPKSDENEHDSWWPKPSDSDPQCKVQ